MDPVTTAILAAIAGGLAEKVGESALLDSYKKLKALLAKRFGSDSKVLAAVASVEERPDSKARPAVLAEEIAEVGADRDDEILAAAEVLRRAVEAQPGGKQVVVTVRGRFNATATDSSTATVNVNTRR